MSLRNAIERSCAYARMLALLPLLGGMGAATAADSNTAGKDADNPVKQCQRACKSGDDRHAFEACMLECRTLAPPAPPAKPTR